MAGALIHQNHPLLLLEDEDDVKTIVIRKGSTTKINLSRRPLTAMYHSGVKFQKESNYNVEIQQNTDYDNDFKPKVVEGEKNFVRINYLKEKKVTMEEIKAKSKKIIIERKQKEREEAHKKEVLNGLLRGKVITKSSHHLATPSKTESHNISQSKLYTSASSIQNNLSHIKAPQSLKSPDSSSSCSCDSCCRNSHYSSGGKSKVRSKASSSLYRSISSKRGNSSKSTKSLKRMNKSNSSISQITSNDWNHKSQILSASGRDKTAEIVQQKLQTILKIKQDKLKMRQIKKAEKDIQNELYGIFSKQSRDERQKKLEQMALFSQVQRSIEINNDPEVIQRVDMLVRESLYSHKYQQMKEDEEKAKEKQFQKVKLIEAKVHLDQEIAQIKRSMSRGNSKEQKYQWGVDQAKFEEKEKVKEEKIFSKQKVDIKSLFSENPIKVVKQKHGERKQVRGSSKDSNRPSAKGGRKENRRNNSNKQRSSNEGSIPFSGERRKLTKDEFEEKMKVRIERIIQEKKDKAKQITDSRRRKKDTLNKIEKERMESLSKCKKIPFVPSSKEIEAAFTNIIDNDPKVNEAVVINEKIEVNKDQKENKNQQKKQQLKGQKNQVNQIQKK